MATTKDEIAALRDEVSQLREQLGQALVQLALRQGSCIHYHWNAPPVPQPYPWSPAYPVYPAYPIITYGDTTNEVHFSNDAQLPGATQSTADAAPAAWLAGASVPIPAGACPLPGAARPAAASSPCTGGSGASGCPSP